MNRLVEFVESYSLKFPPKWRDDSGGDGTLPIWGLDLEVSEPDTFNFEVEQWFQQLADYLDSMCTRTRNPEYKRLADWLLSGIEIFRSQTKEQAVDYLVQRHGGKPNSVVDDNSGLVWSRLTRCSALSSWIGIIAALPNHRKY